MHLLGLALARDIHASTTAPYQTYRARSVHRMYVSTVVSWNLRAFSTRCGESNYLGPNYGPGYWYPEGWEGGEGKRLVQTSPLSWRP